MAIAIYSRCCSAYHAAQEAGVLQLPVISPIKRYIDAMKCHDGCDLNVYTHVTHTEGAIIQWVQAAQPQECPLVTIGGDHYLVKISKMHHVLNQALRRKVCVSYCYLMK
jgi:hypothetical protein